MILSIIGNTCLGIAITSCSIALITRRIQFIAFYIGSIFAIIAFGVLVFGFITSDFALKNVFLNSSSAIPLLYRVAASWANHEGSFLLWFGMLCIVSMIYIIVLRKHGLIQASQVSITILASIYIGLICFILYTSNPFEYLSITTHEGLGLNPMLQDMALSIHPPILYLGNVCYAVPFIGALAILHNPIQIQQILFVCQKFSSFALAMLTTGIGLGSWWAYRELGWGGYWFFDPVENIAIMPWFSSIALHHFFLIYQKKQKFLRSIIVLSIINFLLVLYGTFIVRSGIISSVHGFAFAPERGQFLFIISSVLTIYTFCLFRLKYKALPSPLASASTSTSTSTSTSVYSKQELFIVLGNIMWLIALFTLVMAIIYPVYCYFFYTIDIAIDPEYFHVIFIPLIIPIIILMNIALDHKVRHNKSYFLTSIVIILAIAYICRRAHIGILSSSFLVGAAFLIIQVIHHTLSAAGYDTKKLGTKKIAMILGHAGFGLLVLAITLNQVFKKEVTFIGNIGDRIEKNDLIVTLQDIKLAQGINYLRQIAVFQVEDNNNIILLKPENRFYQIEKSLSQEVDIFSFIFYDLYAVLNQVKDQTIYATIHYQPFISFIWLAVALISFSFLVSCWCRPSKTYHFQ